VSARARDRYRTLRLCASGGGFEAVPDGSLRVDLRAVREALEGEGIRVVDARVMLIASAEAETTISASGRVLIKTADPAVAERVFARIRPMLEEPSGRTVPDTAGARSG